MKVTRAVIFTIIISLSLLASPALAVSLQADLVEIYTAPIILKPGPTLGCLSLLGLAFASDQGIRDYALDRQSPTGDNFFGSVTHLGHPAVGLAIAGGLTLAGEDEVAYKSANAVIYSGFATQAIKLIVGRPRPYVENRRADPLSWDDDHWSFPSGHTASAFALARVLAEEYPDYKVLFYGGAVLVGLSRIYLDKHYISDVVAGAAIGFYLGRHVEANTHLFAVKY